jgi:amino acid transporter
MGGPRAREPAPVSLHRHFGLLHATALNISQIVGAGVFATIPLMLLKLPGPYALLGWLVGGVLMLADGLVWSELGATLPGSGGSYLYLLECYGRERWGRLTAFLFVWQFLVSGPLELGSGLIAMATFSTAFSPAFAEFNKHWTWRFEFWHDAELAVSVSPTRLLALGVGAFILVLLYRRITVLGRWAVAIWLGVLAVIGWILVEGLLHFDPARAFDFSGAAATWPPDFATGLGATMLLAMYSYLGYYNICYLGDEVRDPGRTIPRSIMFSALAVCILFTGVHLALLGTVPWQEVLKKSKDIENYSLAADFMGHLHGHWAVILVTLFLIWSCFGSTFAGLLGYSRIPYGAARYGHFFSLLARVHPQLRIPHLSLLFVGALMLFWTLFDLEKVITAMLVTRIVEQFVAQIVGVVLLRRREPDRPRPYRMWLYPLPCAVALVGWLYLYGSAEWPFIVLGLATLLIGAGVFLVWSLRTRQWPFAEGLAKP